jgi:hypothetical protein
MAGHFLYKSQRVEITPTIARFDSTSYQIANIGSVAVGSRRSMSSAAVVLIFCAALAAFVGFVMVQPDYAAYIQYSPFPFVIGVVLLAAGLVWQHLWPVISYTLYFKTSMGVPGARVARISATRTPKFF